MILKRVLVHLRAAKLKCVTGGLAARTMVPLIEAAEVGLTEGPMEVYHRAKLRIAPRREEMAVPLWTPSVSAEAPVVVPPAGPELNVSIVIPVLNNLSLTLQCLRA